MLKSDAPLQKKAVACERLAVIGTPDAINTLAALLADEADLFDWLTAREPGSLGGIFMAHVIEHLHPRDWSRFVDLKETSTS